MLFIFVAPSFPLPNKVQILQDEIQALPQSDSNLAVKDYLPLLFRINLAFLSNKFPEPAPYFLTYTFAFHVSPSLHLLLKHPSLPAPPRNSNHTSRTTPINTFFILHLLGWNCAYFLCAPISSTPLPTCSAPYTTA